MVETVKASPTKGDIQLTQGRSCEEWRARLPMHVVEAIKGDYSKLSTLDKHVLETIAARDWSQEHLQLSNQLHREFAGMAVARGLVMCYGFGNFYAVASHPRWEAVRHVNLSKGRPEKQVGSITTTRKHMEEAFDWKRIPQGLSKSEIIKLMDELYGMGPFGFRGPAAKNIPNHLISEDEGVRTTQIIAPGYSCESNKMIEEAINRIDENYLFITSANLSRHAKGTSEEPAHYKIEGIKADFGGKPGYFMVAHEDEEGALKRYPDHQPMSTSVISFHKTLRDESGRPALALERHGSLDVADIIKVTDKHGFGLIKGPKAQERLQMRQY